MYWKPGKLEWFIKRRPPAWVCNTSYNITHTHSLNWIKNGLRRSPNLHNNYILYKTERFWSKGRTKGAEPSNRIFQPYSKSKLDL